MDTVFHPSRNNVDREKEARGQKRRGFRGGGWQERNKNGETQKGTDGVSELVGDVE